MKRLPDSELEIMLIIWNADEAVTRVYIQQHLERTRELAATTILSFLSRLKEKGFLRVETIGKTNYYYPLVSREDYSNSECKTMLERYFGNSVKDFVAQLSGANALNQKQILELKGFLDKLMSEENNK